MTAAASHIEKGPDDIMNQTKLTDLYDPMSNSWRSCADMNWLREYHAVTVLVPDGRVVTTAGTGGPAQPGVSNDVEAFEPPYLFRGIRPRIDAISTTSDEPRTSIRSQRRACSAASARSCCGSESPKFTTVEMRRPPHAGHDGWPATGCCVR